MILRTIANEIKNSLSTFPVISVTGPRQSGKTTLVKSLFPDCTYFSLERPDIKNRAMEDPIRFLRSSEGLMILDEIQNVPELLSYIQSEVDEAGEMGRFIISGSQNLVMSDNISQSLSGRVRTFKLLPFSIDELTGTKYESDDINDYLFKGFYPAIYDRGIDPYIWFQNYIETYIERDVRATKNITNLNLFRKFVCLCAGRIGQLLNMNSLANECGISHNTVNGWISILEASYVVYRLRPFHINFGKRIVKQPKLYFYDTGLACSLLELQKQSQVRNIYMRGELFENMIINEYIKYRFNKGMNSNAFFWRDRYQNEIDLIIDKGDKLIPVEIKSGETINEHFFKGLKYWNAISKSNPEENILIYGGNDIQGRKNGKIYGWNSINEFINTLYV